MPCSPAYRVKASFRSQHNRDGGEVLMSTKESAMHVTNGCRSSRRECAAIEPITCRQKYDRSPMRRCSFPHSIFELLKITLIPHLRRVKALELSLVTLRLWSFLCYQNNPSDFRLPLLLLFTTHDTDKIASILCLSIHTLLLSQSHILPFLSGSDWTRNCLYAPSFNIF